MHAEVIYTGICALRPAGRAFFSREWRDSPANGAKPMLGFLVISGRARKVDVAREYTGLCERRREHGIAWSAAGVELRIIARIVQPAALFARERRANNEFRHHNQVAQLD